MPKNNKKKSIHGDKASEKRSPEKKFGDSHVAKHKSAVSRKNTANKKNVQLKVKPVVKTKFKALPPLVQDASVVLDQPQVHHSKKMEVPAKLSVAEIKEIKIKLEALKSDAAAKIQEKKDLDMPEAEVGDPIDQASQSLDKEILFEMTDNDHQMIEQIESALRRIEKGNYGICEACRCHIPTKRLKALPFARYCVNCQTTSETSSETPPTATE